MFDIPLTLPTRAAPTNRQLDEPANTMSSSDFFAPTTSDAAAAIVRDAQGNVADRRSATAPAPNATYGLD